MGLGFVMNNSLAEWAVEILLKNGARADDFLLVDEKQYINAFHLAAARGKCSIMTLLLNHGASLQLINNVGQTALHWAASNGQPDAVKYCLLQRPIDANAKDTKGDTPLVRAFYERAQTTDHGKIVRLNETIQLLLPVTSADVLTEEIRKKYQILTRSKMIQV